MTWPFTHAQKQALNSVEAFLPDTVKQLKEFQKQFTDAVVELPHLNEDGEKVVHGCNMAMYRRAERLEHVIRDLEVLLCT